MTSLATRLGAPVGVLSSPRFILSCEGWTTGLAFAELSGFTSSVDHAEYSYAGPIGTVHAKQFGRAKPPQITLKRAADAEGFARMFAWHLNARMNNPIGTKVPASFIIMDKGGMPHIQCELVNAWCSRLDLDPAQAGGGAVVNMKVVIECDQILPLL